jgi:hypothetical protein
VVLALAAAEAAAQEPLAQQQPATSDARATGEARADALFQEGKRLFDAGRYADACAKLAESDALGPTVSSLGLLAGCHEHQGRIATAWREYLTTAARAEDTGDERAAFARERAAALEPRLPKLVIRLKQAAPGVEVLRNREPMPAGEIGNAIPVDPGEYEIIARGPGKQDFRLTVTLKEGAQAVVTVPPLQPPGVPPVRTADPQRRTAPAEGGARLPAALIAGGIGLAGVGVGIGFGLSAMSKSAASDTLRESCRTPEDCDRGRALLDGAYAASTVSTIGFGVGLAGLGASALILLLSGSGGQDKAAPAHAAVAVTPVAGARQGGAVVRGRF